MHKCVYTQRPGGVSVYHSPPYFIRQSLSQNPEFISSTRPAGQARPWIPLSSSPQCWDYMHTLPHLAIYVGARTQTHANILAFCPLSHLLCSRYSSLITHLHYGGVGPLSTTHMPKCCALCRHSLKSHGHF